jgi:hypothetical protein
METVTELTHDITLTNIIGGNRLGRYRDFIAIGSDFWSFTGTITRYKDYWSVAFDGEPQDEMILTIEARTWEEALTEAIKKYRARI